MNSLAEERAQAEVVAKFERIKGDVMIPFADKYLEAADEIAEAQKQSSTPKVDLPKPELLKAVAEKEGLEYDITDPPLSRDRAEKYGLISGAEVGLTRLSGGRKFTEELFDTKSSLFEPIEFTDAGGRRFLVRKLQDLAPRCRASTRFDRRWSSPGKPSKPAFPPRRRRGNWPRGKAERPRPTRASSPPRSSTAIP